jgi:hypothetical protein
MVQALSHKDFKTASSLMASKIENVFSEPKIFEVIKATSEEVVSGQIEFELIRLASLMSVGGNLNGAQIPFIAKSLMELYPNESIADFKICFERGSIGFYGDIQRMDGITINSWMKKYLDQKYEMLEKTIENEKNKQKQKVNFEPVINSTETDKIINEYLESLSKIEVKAVRPITPDEIQIEGKDDPGAAYRAYRENYIKNRKP